MASFISTVAAKRTTSAALGVAILASFLAPFNAAHGAANFGDTAFESVWARTDRPVQERMAARTWMWGPEPFNTRYEPYAQGPAGQHLVTYFDKSRMEINKPSADRNSPWYVTNGLLVVDMMSGRVQVGDDQFAQASPPANIPVAGDTATSLNAPTYASLARFASLKGDNRAPNRTGQSVREGLSRNGGVGIVDNLSGFARYAVYEPTLGHNIPDVFWSFMNQRGVTYDGSRYLNNQPLVDWLFAMGYPITEPYWIPIKVGDQDRWVLMQAFQRRILTYSPYNPEGWKVEMSNVGRAYFDWRYNQPAPQPTATATPTPRPQASITLDKDSGNVDTKINVRGNNFPANATALIGVEKPSANYFRGVATVAIKADGTFSLDINIPSDAARFDNVTITATANAGGVRASQTFWLKYQASITLKVSEVVFDGAISVTGQGFPANTNMRLGIIFPDQSIDWMTTIKTNNAGAFEEAMPVGDTPIGTKFSVVALADHGHRATSTSQVTVIAHPRLQVTPNSGPAGVHVTLRGSRWPANRAITVGTRAVGNQTEAWLPSVIYSDGAGNFAVSVPIYAEYAGYREIRLMAAESKSQVRIETSYNITAAPNNPAVSISPNVLAVGQAATVTGSKFPAGAAVAIGLGRTAVEEAAGTAYADANGNFSHSFVLSARWQNAGQVTVFATASNGARATTTFSAGTAARIAPAGLPMEIYSHRHKNGQMLLKVKAEGWQPGRQVGVSLISADGRLNQPVGNATVKEDGRFEVTFEAAMPWWGRADLGVRATTADGQQFSVRYLPFTDMVKVSGDTYVVRGHNWPAGARIVALVRTEEDPNPTVGVVNADGNGYFEMTVTMPKMPGSKIDLLEIKAIDQPYTARFDH